MVQVLPILARGAPGNLDILDGRMASEIKKHNGKMICMDI